MHCLQILACGSSANSVIGMPSRKPLPLTVAELQEMNRTATGSTERRLLWEVHRLRKVALQPHELHILLTEDRLLGRDLDSRR
jgi:hypothetical protein